MSNQRESRPASSGAAPNTTSQVDTAENIRPGHQIAPIGPHPDVDVLLIGALLWSTPAAAADVLALVLDDDVASPVLSEVLATIRRLIDEDKPCSAQLVA